MKKIILFLTIFAFMPFALHAVAASPTIVNDVQVSVGANKIEVFLKLQGAYDKKPRITIENQYKGVIFGNLSSLRKNERIKDSFLSEVQVFELSGSLYVLGVGDPEIIDVSISRNADTYKIDFIKTPKKPTHLDILMDKTLNAPISDLSANVGANNSFGGNSLDSENTLTFQNLTGDFSESILNLPSPQNSQAINSQLDSQNQTSMLTQATLESVAKNTAHNIADSEVDLSKLETQGNLIDSWRYFALAGLLALLILTLLIIKKIMGNSNAQFLQNSKNAGFLEIFKNTENIKIIAQKKIDAKNKIVTIHANGNYYLVLMGEHSTTLLDRFNSDGTQVESGFGDIAKQNIKAASQKTQMPANLVIEDSTFAKLLEQKEQRLKRLKDEQNS